MSSKRKYNESDAESITYHTLILKGKTFRDVLDMDLHPEFDKSAYENKNRKGGLGNLIEEHFFGYKANSNQEADFPKAGVELKVTPFIINSKGQARAKERMVITMISYAHPVEEDFLKSHVWDKCKSILIIFYLHDYDVPNKIDNVIKHVILFAPPSNDLKIIEDDYKKIIDKIKQGRAEELSEGDTMYLGACTKGATMQKSIVPQSYYAPDKIARKRAFCFKNSYMTYILNNYVLKNHDSDDTIVGSNMDLTNSSFEEIVKSKISRYVGYSDRNLCNEFDFAYTQNKAQWNTIVFRMLGIKSNNAQEFKKANIVVKTIRLNKNGKNIESISLPPMSFLDLVDEGDWENSTLCDYFSSTKFLFVVFQEQDDRYTLAGCQLWNMSNKDLIICGEEWTEIRNKIIEGPEFSVVELKDGKIRIDNNLPKKSDTKIIHIRPHASKSYYELSNGVSYGSGNVSDSDVLPNGMRMTKQSFWLNNDYILSQLDKSLIK